MIDGALYASNALGFVEAFDPGTGETLWVQEPVETTLQEVSGTSTRGLDVWVDGSDRRLFLVRGVFNLRERIGNDRGWSFCLH